MKKIALIIALCSFFWAEAQDSTVNVSSSNNSEFMPVKGDIGVGFKVSLLSITNFTNPSSSNANEAFLRYFLSESTAVRARLGLSYSRRSDENWVTRDGASEPWDQVRDQQIRHIASHRIALGLEKRPAKLRSKSDRIQGYYGGSAILGYQSTTGSITYGNGMARGNVAPTSTSNFNAGFSGQARNRLTSFNTGHVITGGVRGFVGAEIFIMKNFSASFEVGTNLLYTFQSREFQNFERFTTELETYSTITDRSGSFSTETDNLDGALVLMLYF